MAAPNDRGEPRKRSKSTTRRTTEDGPSNVNAKTILHMECSIQTFETFLEEWYAKVQRLKSRNLNDDDTFLRDAFLQNIDDEVIEFLKIRLGSLERISVSQASGNKISCGEMVRQEQPGPPD